MKLDLLAHFAIVTLRRIVVLDVLQTGISKYQLQTNRLLTHDQRLDNRLNLAAESSVLANHCTNRPPNRSLTWNRKSVTSILACTLQQHRLQHVLYIMLTRQRFVLQDAFAKIQKHSIEIPKVL